MDPQPAPATRTITASRPPAAERRRFLSEIGELELRLAVIDDRFEALARRAGEAYGIWRGDTLGRAQRLASRAAQLERAGCLAPGERQRVAALLVTLRKRIEALDLRHDELRG
ncbi:hypothetical protein ET445_06210 [Agromyces protaetiae]|uniref:Uncharacterized protein n=1 Tax=Agromyces protaetiae TaxID=2509455 RepID=A0A4P6FR41_9MICO|nr:hypothetical protein [Agromyces protaetiae]QAY72998.1 hypothetical protein ET445_06210 [Agromyces protaetiae]